MLPEPIAREAHASQVASSEDSPIFIVGMSRSGTTLLSSMLDTHSEIAILPETWLYVVLDRLGCLQEFTDPWQTSLFLNEVWENLKAYRDPAARVLAREASKDPRYVGPTVRLVEKLGQAYAKERGAKIWGEKTPGHALWLPQIRDLFPRARVVFMVRDPRDVLVSYDDRWDRGRRDTDYLTSTAALLKFFLLHLMQSPAFPPEQIHWVKYESLTAQPDDELQKVCDFLGIDFEPTMLDFYHRHANVERDMAGGRHHALLSKPATTQQIGRYQKAFSPSQIALVETLLSEEMRALGYPLSNHHGVSFDRSDKKSLSKAQERYRKMVDGEVRSRLRRRGMLKLHVYQIFGRALGVVPPWRIATTDSEWGLLAKEHPAVAGAGQSSPSRPANGAAAASQKPSFQTEISRISGQSGVVFAGTIFAAAIGYAFKVYVARVLGAEALGLYALGVTIISFIGIFNVLGLPESAVRFVALYSASKKFAELRALLWNGASILLISNLISAAVLWWAGPWIATRFYHSPQLVRYLPLFVPMMILSALTTFYGNVLAGYREVGRRTMVTRFVATPVTMVGAILLIRLGTGLWGYLAAQILSAMCVAALLIAMVWRLTPEAARSLDFKRLGVPREVWSFSAAMFGVGMMHFLIGQTDRVALGVYRGPNDVGIYAVAAALIAYETIILQSVNQIFAPVIADIHARGEHALLGRLFRSLTKWILGLTLPLAIVMIIYSRSIMGMFGHDFEAGWPILIVGTCGQLVNCGVGSVGYLLLMSGNQRRLVRVQMVMAALMVVLSFKLVPLWGALGAMIAAAITNTGTNLWNLVEVRKALKLSPYDRSYLKLLPATGGALLVTLLVSKGSRMVRTDLLGVMAALLLAYAVFAIVVLAMGSDADDHLITNAIWERVGPVFGRKRSAASATPNVELDRPVDLGQPGF